ncbi:5-hydroxytryptamine receptor 2A [Teleopsis dalmanni]|uniref:5-hydroxytryptamine receptor 2A n=1 Tax=Teleopsis dalmanni TaxID=139649 RepID=UPI0018CF4C73|nr:5-hydroxytryptamine receptor 2A [Teleopsis dalmanni]
MKRKPKFKDALDYIYISDDSDSNTFLISSNGRGGSLANAISATATTVVTLASAVIIDKTTASDNYNGVAVDMGSMLLNNTLEDNNTSFFGENVNGSDLMANSTETDTSSDDLANLLKMAVTSVVLGLMILITIIGNVFVIAAIILERNLQNVANYLVASLAVADLFVACLVMPLGAVYEISDGWILGPELCDIWTSCDVLCCTASILHLVAIAVDRYWAVTNIDYIHSRTSRRVFLMIFLVWSASVVISLAPQFGWKDPDYLQRIEQQKCMVSQDVGYQVFATCCTFYVPLFVILVLYWKIYQTARKRIHRRRPKPINPTGNNNQVDVTDQKKRRRLRLRIGKQAGEQGATGPALGLVEGNSTNTVNTVEDTEFSSSNVDSKSRAGNEATTTFTNSDELATTSAHQISTVSHLVALANQQHAATTSGTKSQKHISLELTTVSTTNTNADVELATTAITSPTKITIVASNGTNNIEVLEDPQLQQQLHQVQQHTTTGGASTSNATTITSISAISPQTPTACLGACSQMHQLSDSASASNQVTPVPRPKNSQYSISNPLHKVAKRKETLEAKRERKAAKTLAIITGAFVVCWLPFFVMALMLPLCVACRVNDSVLSLFLWLGYFNSTLNPVIYTIFSPEFRQAFKRILYGAHRSAHYRSGKI